MKGKMREKRGLVWLAVGITDNKASGFDLPKRKIYGGARGEYGVGTLNSLAIH